MNRPRFIYHADWSSNPAKRWCARAILGSDGRYTVAGPELVGGLTKLLNEFDGLAGESESVFVGFDFPIGVPEHYAKRAGVTRFPEFLQTLGAGDWKYFYSVCDRNDEISTHRPFYPNRYAPGCCQQHLLDAHEAADMSKLRRQCELGSNGQRQACSLFWTLGGNQVGKAAIVGWRDVLVPALSSKSARIWPFDGELEGMS